MKSAAKMVRQPAAQGVRPGPGEGRRRATATAAAPFGQGCLLARRLVESGVTFVEVESDGWDTHQDNFDRVKALAGPIDPGFAALVGDLKERGMLERTLVVWMGEFGRTPRINGQTGRDHFRAPSTSRWPAAASRAARSSATTSPTAATSRTGPVTVPDLFCTFCQALKINPRKENIGPWAGRSRSWTAARR